MTTPWTDEHSKLVAAATPDAAQPSETDLDRVWNRVAGELDAPPVRRRLKVRMVVGAGAVAAVVGVSGFAAADILSARTGEGPADAEDLSLGGPGERLSPAGSDFASVIAEEAADIPFPSERARQQSVAFWAHDLSRDASGPQQTRVSTGALRSWMADDAICFWANQWAAATHSGDTDARQEAVDMIDAADTWPAVTESDPAPYSRWKTMQVEDESGKVTTERYRDESLFFYLRRVQRAAGGNDLDAMAGALRASGTGCWTYQVPDLPMANPMYAESH